MLLLVERALSALAISEAVTAGHREEGLMDQHAVVALGRNLGVDLVCATLDDRHWTWTTTTAGRGHRALRACA